MPDTVLIANSDRILGLRLAKDCFLSMSGGLLNSVREHHILRLGPANHWKDANRSLPPRSVIETTRPPVEGSHPSSGNRVPHWFACRATHECLMRANKAPTGAPARTHCGIRG